MNWLRRWWANRGRTCWVHCGVCGHDLNGDSESFIDDIEGLVTYQCAGCGHVSRFDFDHYPVPVLIEEGP